MPERTASRARTLPQKYYTAQAVYDLENERIFSSHWLYAGRESQLPEKGSYFLFEIDNESIIILRDQTGVIRAFYNVCRHRGTRICREAAGQFSKSIQCPYHAWTYALEGQLTGAPNMHEVQSFDKAEYPLHPVALATWEGCVLINLAQELEPFEQAFAPLIGKFSRWHLQELATVHRIEYDIKANWKLVIQNYSECYHCPSLHPVLNRLTPYRNSTNDLLEGPFLGGPMQLSEGSQSMTMNGRACAMPLHETSATKPNLAYYYTIFPNLLLSLFPDYVLLHRVEPQHPAKTRIICNWLFHPDAIAQPDFDPSGAIEFWNMTNNQDWQVSELSQQGISSRVYAPGPYAELESMIAAWDRQYLRVMGADVG
jgi:Rieske 2Fe-2S family protein